MEGKVIIYKDINNNYNVAGNPINMAARLLSEANRNQIVLTETAYKQTIDLSDNPNYSDDFEEIVNVEFKHKITANIYVLKSNKEYINSEIAPKHIRNAKFEVIRKKFQQVASLNMDLDSPESSQEMITNIVEMTTMMGELFQNMNDEKANKAIENSKFMPQLPIQKSKTRRGK